MKNLFVVIFFLGLSVTVKADGPWGEYASDANNIQDQDQNQAISAELDDEIQQASGLKLEEKTKVVKPVVEDKPVTEEVAIENLGKEMDVADVKAHEVELEVEKAQKAQIKAMKIAAAELKKKQKHLKALRTSKKNKYKPAKYVYGNIKAIDL